MIVPSVVISEKHTDMLEITEHPVEVGAAVADHAYKKPSEVVMEGGFAGGGALLRGLDKRLTDKINIPFHIAEDPLLAVAKGTGIALKNVERFSFLMR